MHNVKYRLSTKYVIQSTVVVIFPSSLVLKRRQMYSYYY